MKKKVCVITGSSSGIGAASAILFAQRGWDVCVNYSKDPKPAEKIAAICREHGADVLIERADVSRDEQCTELARRVQTHFGRCDTLVNNAGRRNSSTSRILMASARLIFKTFTRSMSSALFR